MEQQETLIEEKILYNNNLSCGIYLQLWSRKDDHIWRILKYFYDLDINKDGLTIPEIFKIGKKNKCRFGINTVPNCIKRLLVEDMLKLKYSNVGSKKRTNMYSLTTKGEIMWETYIKQR